MDDVVRQLHGLSSEDIAAVHAAFRKIGGRSYEEFLQLCEEAEIYFEELTESEHESENEPNVEIENDHENISEPRGETHDLNIIRQPTSLRVSPNAPMYGNADFDFMERKYTPTLLREMEAKALAFDRRCLIKTALNAWRDEVAHIHDMERTADLWYERGLQKKALHHMQNNARLFMHKMAELERRERAFTEWTDKRAAAKMMMKWVMEHRARSFMDWKNKRAGVKMLETWRQKTALSQARKTAADKLHTYLLKRDTFELWRVKTAKRVAERDFHERVAILRSNIFIRKWLQHWRVVVERRTSLRRFQILMERYYMFVAWRDERLGRRILVTWYEKAMAIKEMEKQADTHWETKQDNKTREMGHSALVTMYNQAMQTKENERVADEHYEHRILFKYLNSEGPLRSKLRQIKEMEAKADEYREIKDQEYAASFLRNWRQQAFITKRREEDADAFYDKWTRKRALKSLQRWRQQTAERRGGREAAERVLAPVTPAARRTLFMAESAALPIRLARTEALEDAEGTGRVGRGNGNEA